MLRLVSVLARWWLAPPSLQPHAALKGIGSSPVDSASTCHREESMLRMCLSDSVLSSIDSAVCSSTRSLVKSSSIFAALLASWAVMACTAEGSTALGCFVLLLLVAVSVLLLSALQGNLRLSSLVKDRSGAGPA